MCALCAGCLQWVTPPALTSSRMRPPSRPRVVEAAGTTTPASHCSPAPSRSSHHCDSGACDRPSDPIARAAHRGPSPARKSALWWLLSRVGASTDAEAEPHCRCVNVPGRASWQFNCQKQRHRSRPCSSHLDVTLHPSAIEL